MFLCFRQIRVYQDRAANRRIVPLEGTQREELHGYGIMQEVQRQSEGKYKLGPGTLYHNLQKLIERRLVEELGHRPADDDPRRRYYRLSALGRGVLTAEIARLDDVVREGKLRLQTKPRRA